MQSAQKVGAHFQRPGAADGLHGDGAPGLNNWAVGPKYELLDCLVVGGQAFDWQIGARRLLFHQDFFGFAHAGEQRHFAIVVIIDPDAQVDLRWIGVGVESLGNAQNRVARGHVDGAENAGGS